MVRSPNMTSNRWLWCVGVRLCMGEIISKTDDEHGSFLSNNTHPPSTFARMASARDNEPVMTVEVEVSTSSTAP